MKEGEFHVAFTKGTPPGLSSHTTLLPRYTRRCKHREYVSDTEEDLSNAELSRGEDQPRPPARDHNAANGDFDLTIPRP